MMHNTVLLEGIVGSTAYGLDHAGSDLDRLGVYAAPTIAFHGLHPPTAKNATKTLGPDHTRHEAGKYCALLLGCNPTAMELLWLPRDDLYEQRTDLGNHLIGIRRAFLSARRVRDAYLGYATGQFHELAKRGDGTFSSGTRNRTAKHARHLARLINQGVELYKTGTLQVRIDNPDWYHEFGKNVAAGDVRLAQELLVAASYEFETATPALPDRPDEATVERWLLLVRAAHFPAGADRG